MSKQRLKVLFVVLVTVTAVVVFLTINGLFPPSTKVAIPDIPAFVTAFSSSHFEEGRAMLYNFNETVRRRYPNLKLYFFDIGLSKEEALEIKTICQCVYKIFPFDEFPSHLQILIGYAWKPLAIQLVIREHPFVIWMDASIRYTTSNIDGIIDNAKREGVLAKLGYGKVIVNHTLKTTFEMLKTDPWSYKGRIMFCAAFVVLRATPYITQYILRPWISCALKLGCMVPTERVEEYKSCRKRPVKYFGCHRFDQSVLSILIHMLYGENALKHVVCKRNCEYFLACRSCRLIGVLEKVKPNAKMLKYL